VANKYFEYSGISNVADPSFKSLALVMSSNQVKFANLACIDGDWIVGLSTPNGFIKVPWSAFAEMFNEFTVFMASETKAMLTECEENNGSGSEETE
jgi:hypothetical protein